MGLFLEFILKLLTHKRKTKQNLEERPYGKAEDGSVSWGSALQPGSCLYHALYPTGERPGCGSACGYHSCPEGYCSNGGRCHLHPITCTPTCTCPPAFTDQHCLVAGGDFRPLPSTGGYLCPAWGETQPHSPWSWDARAATVAFPQQIFLGEASR